MTEALGFPGSADPEVSFLVSAMRRSDTLGACLEALTREAAGEIPCELIVVMEPSDYQTWLSGGAPEGSLASAGEKLFQDLACITCHRADAQGRGPLLQGLFGKTVQLQNGGEDPHNLRIESLDGSGTPIDFPITTPGTVSQQRMTLPAGSYKLYCTLSTHDAQGMHATLTVAP